MPSLNKDIAGWQVSPRKIMLETPVANISSGPVKCLRTGKEVDFYHFDFPEWVNIVALTPEKELIMIKQFRYGTGRLELEIPGGVVHKGEDPVIAGCRELLEETGFQGRDARLIGRVCPNPALQGNNCFTVLVEDVEKVGEPQMDDMEDIEISIITQKKVAELINNGTISHGLVLNALMFYEKYSLRNDNEECT